MKVIQIFSSLLFISSILSDELIRTVSFESIFPSTPEEKLHSIDNFNQWFAEINQANAVQVTQAKHGLGLFSDNKILAGQDILKIPLETCIYIGILQDYDIFWEMVYSKIKDQEDALAIFILSEIRNFKKSSLSYYLKILPQYTLAPIGYSEDLLQLLKIDETYALTKKRISILKQSFNDLRKLIYSLPPQIKGKLIGKFSFSDYIWARWIIDSRGVIVEGKKYIVPGGDFINHVDLEGRGIPSCEINGKEKFNEKYNIPDVKEGSFSVFASRDHERLNEITEAYGEHSNFYYFNYKGFASLNNTYDCYEVDLANIFSFNININLFKSSFVKAKINTTSICLSSHNISLEKLDFILKILSTDEKESICSENLSKLEFNDPFLYQKTPCSFYIDQYNAYINQLIMVLENKISLYNKQLSLPVFEEENVKKFHELGVELIRNIETYLKSRILLFKNISESLGKIFKVKEDQSINIKIDL